MAEKVVYMALQRVSEELGDRIAIYVGSEYVGRCRAGDMDTAVAIARCMVPTGTPVYDRGTRQQLRGKDGNALVT